ncbi:uncharacterized protein LOC103511163 [Diaphorina citri]|uniref:Uncharacterized protein LOC103511163 n=1 Tax=Diaphorina citri TaxID=121845 RepID=A0A1S3D4B9_DIACI|nr:uncharacterized protein LOC103511163 [Diaphorina citri]KAI5730576.1 hypothetical protein M8J76_015325 [Diaphorina citri]KAI5734215.1 hypothetical protein M8J77_003889 [Diaphorina citri]
MITKLILLMLLLGPALCDQAPDKDDTEDDVTTTPASEFEAFYPREAYGIPNSVVRAPHGHGSFYKYRNPALVDTKNAAAYGFRFDGKRRFNFD